MKEKRLCACGCGGEMVDKDWHKYPSEKQPKYIRYHHLKKKETHPSWKGGLTKNKDHVRKRDRAYDNNNREKLKKHRINAEKKLKEWADKQKPIPCSCGCGEMVKIRWFHRYKKTDKYYINGHTHRNRCGSDSVSWKGFGKELIDLRRSAKACIKKSTGIACSDLPEEILNLKIEHLKIIRKIKKEKQNENTKL